MTLDLVQFGLKLSVIQLLIADIAVEIGESALLAGSKLAF
jgi:hypothetical protein